MVKILKKICDKRLETIEERGLNFGIELPAEREVPLSLPNMSDGLTICEIKRGSPSEGRMDAIESPLDWVKSYEAGGAGAISVLTEEDHFFGSLNDLIEIKRNFPQLTILRKDFLQFEEEIELSYRAGADMVLLITGMFMDNIEQLKRMKERAEALGMLPLIEVHDLEELELILPLKPSLIGINSRDLKTFKIDKNYPIALKNLTGESDVIFESGIKSGADSYFAGACGFSGLLVGTSIVKSGRIEEKIGDIRAGFARGRANRTNFYKELFRKVYLEQRPVVKICGITNKEDALCAASEGADLIGFILAESPRRVTVEQAREISRALPPEILKVAVVTDQDSPEVEELIAGIKEGWLSAIQFHGSEIDDERLKSLDTCWYRAINLSSSTDIDRVYSSPIVLFDAFVKGAQGGTGKQIAAELLDYALEQGKKLYLAGGINPLNAGELVKKYSPAMLDLSSGVESAPGKKDHEKIKALFQAIKEASS